MPSFPLVVEHGLLVHLNQEDEPMSESQTALVVDDDESLAVAAILLMEGFEGRTADNGAHGFAAYFRKPTDWVVTDIQMPELELFRSEIRPKFQIIFG